MSKALLLLDDILANKGPITLAKDSIVVTQQEVEVDQRAREETADTYAKFVRLQNSIESCDSVLASLQTYLEGFQSELLSVTSEIESLHVRSSEMDQRLANRKKLEALLGPIIEENVLSPTLIMQIVEAPVDRAWLQCLDRLESFGQKDEVRDDLPKFQIPSEEIDKLRMLAVARIRNYLVDKIRSLRMPKANVQIIQQSGLMKLRRLYMFLCKYHSQLGDEIMQAYCFTMRWYYQTSFDKYQKALQKVPIRVLNKSELLGAEETNRSGIGNMFSTKVQQTTDNPVLELGTRSKHLDNNTSGIILAHVAEGEKEPYYLERVFRSYVVALVENASVEYLFMTEFFKSKSVHQTSDSFNIVLEPTLIAANTFVKALIAESLDAIGLLSCIRVCQKLLFDLQKRRVAGLEGFLDKLLIALWPKLQNVMDLHSQAIQKAHISASTVNESAKNKVPLTMTKKFTSLVHGILRLSVNSREEEPVFHSLDRLIHDFESCLARMAVSCEPKLRNVFLFRNYLYIANQIESTSGTLAEKHKKRFMESVASMR